MWYKVETGTRVCVVAFHFSRTIATGLTKLC
jgi:hypothetical protein